MSKITFVRGQGALGRPLPNKDHVSAICLPIADANLPSGFSTTARIKKIFSLAEAEAAGVVSTDSNTEFAHYQISEIYRLNPKAEVYVYLYDSTTSAAATYLQPVIEFPEDGEIRQAAIFFDGALDTAELGDIQTVAEAMQAAHRPFTAIVGFSAFADDYDWSSAPDLRAQDKNLVSVVVGCDVDGAGGALASALNNVPAIGAVLGAVSAANVHESIGWIDRFNFSNGTELEKTALGDPALLSNDLSTTLADALLAKGYIFFKKEIGITGSYAVDSPTCAAITSDYAYIEANRTMDKAIRGIRTRLLPNLNAPVYLEGGLIREDSAARIKADAEKTLDEMRQNGEISEGEIIINPAQDILGTSKLVIGAKIVPVGVSREIEVNIAFAVKVSS